MIFNFNKIINNLLRNDSKVLDKINDLTLFSLIFKIKQYSFIFKENIEIKPQLS